MPAMLIFGAGLIGRGLLAEVAEHDGWDSVLVEARASLLAQLRAAGQYQVRLEGLRTAVTQVRRFRVFSPSETKTIAAQVSGVELAATAVGGANLRNVAQLLASGLRARSRPLHILVCENWPHADQVLRKALWDFGVPERQAVCVPVSVERIVRGCEGSLDLVGEMGESAYLDAHRLPTDIPVPADLVPVLNLEAYYARKLFTNNAGHALLAYEGYLAGHIYLPECMADPAIVPDLERLLRSAAQMLERQYQLSAVGLNAHVENLTRWRYANQNLADTVRRVAREPKRKLNPNERLVGLLRRLEQWQLPTAPVYKAIAAALLYNDASEPQCMTLQQELHKEGLAAVLERICRIQPDEPARRMIEEQYNAIKNRMEEKHDRWQ